MICNNNFQNRIMSCTKISHINITSIHVFSLKKSETDFYFESTSNLFMGFMFVTYHVLFLATLLCWHTCWCNAICTNCSAQFSPTHFFILLYIFALTWNWKTVLNTDYLYCRTRITTCIKIYRWNFVCIYWSINCHVHIVTVEVLAYHSFHVLWYHSWSVVFKMLGHKHR